MDEMPGGWLVRGLHSAGASSMVILLVLHMLQVTLYGAYRRPREANWFVEAAFPITAARNSGYALAAVIHTGFAF